MQTMQLKHCLLLIRLLACSASVILQPTQEVHDKIVLRRPKLPKNGVWVHSDKQKSANLPLKSKAKEEVGEEDVHPSEKKEAEEEQASHHTEGAEEEAMEAESFSLSVFLVGGVGAVMFVLHLLHWPSWQGDVKGTTIRVMNMTFSIFVAVLVYSVLNTALIDSFEPGLEARVVLTLVLFLVLYVGSHYVLFRLKGKDKTQMVATSTIMAHITGFAAMYGFSEWQEYDFFESLGAKGIAMVIVIAALTIGGLATIMSKVMTAVALSDGDDEVDEEWMDTCEEGDDDVFCLAISFLIIGLIRFLIRNKALPYEPGKVGHVTHDDCNKLWWVSVTSLLLVGIGACMMVYLHSGGHHLGPKTNRALQCFQHLVSMTTAWGFLFWAEWQLYFLEWESTVIGGCLIIALFVSFGSLLSVFLLDFITTRVKSGKMFNRAMKSLELSLGVLIGFSWERAFDVGFEEISLKLEDMRHPQFASPQFLVILMSGILFAIVAPAWRYYILPPALASEETEEKEKDDKA